MTRCEMRGGHGRAIPLSLTTTGEVVDRLCEDCGVSLGIETRTNPGTKADTGDGGPDTHT